MEIKERLGLAQKISESKGEKATEFKDSLARMVKSDFDAAVRHRSMHKFGVILEKRLVICRCQVLRS